MTGRRSLFTTRPFLSKIATSVACATATAVGASLLVGCGVLPGATGGSREPVTVMTWAPEGTSATNMPGMPAMAQAYARWANANGGLAGHELRIITCNEHNSTVGASKCAKQAVREGAIAVVGSYSQHGRAFMAPLEVAGIPFIGGYGASDDEFASPLSYPVNGGQAALLAGNGKQLARDCDRVSLVRPDTVAGDALPMLLGAGLAEGERKAPTDIRAAEDASDYTARARDALTGAGAFDAYGTGKGCVTAVLGDRTETFFDSFRRLEEEAERKVGVASVLGSVGQPLVDRTGGKSGPFEGAYVTGWYPVASDARWNPMREVIREHAFADNRIDPADPGVQTTWIAYTVLKATLESLAQGGGDGDKDSVSAADVIGELNRVEGVETGGLTPTLSWRLEHMLATRDLPRIVNRDVTFQVVRQGQLVSAKEGFVDVGDTLVRAPSGA
ncbi:ABC transporter substrate-binding protein [Streptomyces albidochromogenes]|uniref:ABC transporter substrate-binding protein n=1 Tax=Streptomyces albidochromogenes TaxID=329524 RepID=UPI00110F813A|nr:ABC transporter substrate-binding protein [Streptomyces albidochromogenes]